ncbi:hypothetical protein BCV72DRAFT_262542 [Rhizopus microsporus var. microsporus]|uniref:Uncharacterized protein n=2 Tax=Rhizopus microsporus TaxID=58291 RepID=A0A2G4T6X4_RHIZD|nr:uncharacterized protein RHIMIDRAFT_266790 [Rhizopus microsporus ATCC 52813]ORE06743.1 hypothetical protein BCV72DRAFT_262542 [Rhizopus microsporus var. microsporus]PHZ16774.1 hypothetical protein RHIMIDRAFT_266790 [Rhizopus microsporus ATCC 52813]
MRTMLNDLIRLGIPSPSVGGILIQGHQITTFQLDIIGPKLYRMINLCKLNMFNTLDDIVSLPVIVLQMLQAKQIAMDTARKVQTLMSERSTKMKRTRPSYQRLWLSEGGCILRKRSSPNDGG